ncbi:Calcineurin-like phosphoesterase domain-containing protein [Entamoeba marina]
MIAVITIINSPDTPPLIPHTPTDTYFTFLHITDLHVNKYNEQRVEALKTFCDLMPTHAPDGVIVTGDLCHGRKNGVGFTSTKYLDEYSIYNDTVTNCLKKYDTKWFDIKGNHDVDGVYGRENPKNYADKVLRSGINPLSVGSLFIEKNGETAQIIGLDQYPPASIPRDSDGYITAMEYNELKTHLSKTSDYKILATHNPTTWILTGDNDPLSVKIQKDFEKQPVSLALSGHFHFSNMAAYHHGMFEAELNSLKHEIYRVIVLKNNRTYYTDVTFGELPIIPICPGENTIDCVGTEVYVGKNVKGVSVISQNQRINLESSDGKMWKSNEIVSGKDVDIEVIEEDDNDPVSKSFTFGQQYTQPLSYLLTTRAPVYTQCISIFIVFSLMLRIFGGIASKYFKSLSTIPLFDHFHVISTPILLIGSIIVFLSYIVPLAMGFLCFDESDDQLTVYVGVGQGRVGIYNAPFSTMSNLMHIYIIIYVWLSLWTVGHLVKRKMWFGDWGIGLLWLMVLLGNVLLCYYFSIDIVVKSPMTYFEIICILSLSGLRWWKSQNIRQEIKELKQLKHTKLQSHHSVDEGIFYDPILDDENNENLIELENNENSQKNIMNGIANGYFAIEL